MVVAFAAAWVARARRAAGRGMSACAAQRAGRAGHAARGGAVPHAVLPRHRPRYGSDWVFSLFQAMSVHLADEFEYTAR